MASDRGRSGPASLRHARMARSRAVRPADDTAPDLRIRSSGADVTHTVPDQGRRADPGQAGARGAHPAQLLALAQAMPRQPQALTLVAGLCGLRFGEAVALRNRDVDLERGIIHVTHTAVRSGGAKSTGPPKTNAGRRTVARPQAVIDAPAKHLEEFPVANREALLFPGRDGAQTRAQRPLRAAGPHRAPRWARLPQGTFRLHEGPGGHRQTWSALARPSADRRHPRCTGRRHRA